LHEERNICSARAYTAAEVTNSRRSREASPVFHGFDNAGFFAAQSTLQ
jgi:hypothetical protein